MKSKIILIFYFCRYERGILMRHRYNYYRKEIIKNNNENGESDFREIASLTNNNVKY